MKARRGEDIEATRKPTKCLIFSSISLYIYRELGIKFVSEVLIQKFQYFIVYFPETELIHFNNQLNVMPQNQFMKLFFLLF